LWEKADVATTVLFCTENVGVNPVTFNVSIMRFSETVGALRDREELHVTVKLTAAHLLIILFMLYEIRVFITVLTYSMEQSPS
jgi:hypothetical protein